MLDVIDPEYHDALHERWRSEGFCTGLRPYPGAVDGVQRLQEVADVFFVTAPFYDAPFWMWERLNWLKAKFNANDYQVAFVHDKRIVDGDFLVEDRPKHVLAWGATHPDSEVVIWDQAYTRFFEEPTNSFRTKSWDALVERVGSWRPHLA